MLNAQDVKLFFTSPATFFQENPPKETIPIALGAVVIFAIVLTISISLIGTMLAGSLDATIEMDNPDKPAEVFCEQSTPEVSGCDEPDTVERDAGGLIKEEMQGYMWLGIFTPILMMILGTIVVSVASYTAGGDPSLPGVISLAGWACIPEFLRLAAGMSVLWYVTSNLTITDPEQATNAFETAISPVEPVLILASIVTIAWQWSILTGGISEEADLPWDKAAVAMAIPLIIYFILFVL